MLGKTQNPQLQAVEQAISEKVPPELKGAFQRIIVAGEKVLYDKSTGDLVQQQLNQPGDPAHIAGEGVAKLFMLLFQQSKQTMPMKAGIPAAQMLLCEVLSFMESIGKVKVDDALIAAATKELMNYLLQAFGISQEKLQKMATAGARGNSQAPTTESAAPPSGLVQQARGGAQ